MQSSYLKTLRKLLICKRAKNFKPTNGYQSSLTVPLAETGRAGGRIKKIKSLVANSTNL